MKQKSTLSFEEQFKRLEEIVELLDSGDAPLEELLKIFEEGMQLAKSLREFLSKAEQKVIEISGKTKVEEENV
ncbi:MAG: exodeoxyribonuclease VII small subunit [FCB group bacterium]|jgi:exodeoxyribonuclease VII small subunit